MNQKIVVGTAIVFIIVVAIILFNNPERAREVNIPIINQPAEQQDENISGFFGGGGLFGGRGSSGGGGSSGGQTTTSIVIGGTTTTVVGSTTSTSTVPGSTTAITSTAGSTSTTIIGSTTIGTSSTTIQGCPNNFAITYDLDCRETTGNSDDDIYVKIINNEPNGYIFDVFVDGNSEGSAFAGPGGFGLRYSNQITNWWRVQSGSSSRTFSVEIRYLTTCSMTDNITVNFPPPSSECVD